MTKSYKNRAHKVWEEIVELCDEPQIEYLTFIAKADFPQDDDYKAFTSTI